MTTELTIKEDRRKLLIIMEDIVRKCELEALAVVTQSDAEEVAFFTDMDTNVDIFCALAAASLDTATKVTNKMKHGSVLELVVIGDTGFTIMSPVEDQYILIGAGKDFYSLGKTILILREKVKEIPLDLADKKPTTTKRKACSHFCQFDDLYCCVCSNRKENLCDICQNSIQQKRAEQKKLLEEALEKAKQLELESSQPESSSTFAFSTFGSDNTKASQDSQNILNRVMTKITSIEENEEINNEKRKPRKTTRTRKNAKSSTKPKTSKKSVKKPMKSKKAQKRRKK